MDQVTIQKLLEDTDQQIKNLDGQLKKLDQQKEKMEQKLKEIAKFKIKLSDEVWKLLQIKTELQEKLHYMRGI